MLSNLEIACAGSYDGEALEILVRVFLQIVDEVFVKDLIFACRVHFFQFLEDCLGSESSDVRLSYQEIGLEVVFGDNGVVVEGDVDSCQDEVFSELCIGSVGGSDQYSGAEQPKLGRKCTSFEFTSR